MKHGKKNLIVLTADKNMEFSVMGILNRHEALGIRSLSYDIRVHVERDPGCLRKSHYFLKPFANRYAYALVIFDREGCGRDELSREALEQKVEEKLAQNGWSNRSAAIVPDPELEIWVWSDSPHVDTVLGWKDKRPDLRTWMAKKGFLEKSQIKPGRPKEAVECALKYVRKARSSSIYLQIARKVSLNRCHDPAFLKLKSTLKKWFA